MLVSIVGISLCILQGDSLFIYSVGFVSCGSVCSMMMCILLSDIVFWCFVSYAKLSVDVPSTSFYIAFV